MEKLSAQQVKASPKTTSQVNPWTPPVVSELPREAQARLAAQYYISRFGADRDSNRSQAFVNRIKTPEGRAGMWKQIYNTKADPNGTPELYLRNNATRPADAYDYKPALAEYESKYPGITSLVSETEGAESSYGKNKLANGNYFQLMKPSLKELNRLGKFDKAVKWTPPVDKAPTQPVAAPQVASAIKPLSKVNEEVDFPNPSDPNPQSSDNPGQGDRSYSARKEPYKDGELNDLMFALGGPPSIARRPFKTPLHGNAIGTTPPPDHQGEADGYIEGGVDKSAMDPVSVLGAAAGHKALNRLLNYLMRENSITRRPFESYYRGMARSGLRHGMSIKDEEMLPKFRRLIGGMAPNVSGLNDYEIARGLGRHMFDEARRDYGSLVNVGDVVEYVKKNPDALNIVNQDELRSRVDKLKSPLMRNIIGGMAYNEKDPALVKFLNKRVGPSNDGGSGASKVLFDMATGYASHGVPGAVGGVVGGFDDAVVNKLADMPKGVSKLLSAKKVVLGAGEGSSPKVDAAAYWVNPAMGELLHASKDIKNMARMDDHIPLQTFGKSLEESLLAPGVDRLDSMKRGLWDRLRNMWPSKPAYPVQVPALRTS